MARSVPCVLHPPALGAKGSSNYILNGFYYVRLSKIFSYYDDKILHLCMFFNLFATRSINSLSKYVFELISIIKGTYFQVVLIIYKAALRYFRLLT